ncbi:MAG: phage tail protein [Oscillospiraceae bacterium]|jgi:phage tail-like protein|nr:phage tail protein [Oscillospiraceae bacterium]
MTTKIQEPLAAYRFIVEIEDGGSAVQAAFTAFSGIRARTETVTARTGAEPRGVLRHIPALTTYENASLTKGVIGGGVLLDWLKRVAPGNSAAASGKNMFRKVNIYALDYAGTRAIRWTLYDALPVSYELAEMDALQNAVLSEKVEFAYHGYSREVLKG